MTIRRREAKSGTASGLALRRARGVGSRGYNRTVTQPVVHGQHGREAMSPAGTGKMGRQPPTRGDAQKIVHRGGGWLLGTGIRPLDGGPDKLLGPPTLVSNDDA